MLSKHPCLANVPFMYISDHDFCGFQNFFNLKYGSRNLAFLSQTQTCRQLQWIGPTTADLEKVAEAGSQFYVKDQAQNHRSWTNKEREDVRQKWLAKCKKTTEEWITKGEGCQCQKKDDSLLLKNWRTFGLLDLEPKVAKEALAIEEMNHGVRPLPPDLPSKQIQNPLTLTLEVPSRSAGNHLQRRHSMVYRAASFTPARTNCEGGTNHTLEEGR